MKKVINLPLGGTQQQRLSEVQEAKLKTPGFHERRLQQSWRRAVAVNTPEAIREHQDLASRLVPCIEAEWEEVAE